MVIPYRTARFKSANILTIAILGSFNFCQSWFPVIRYLPKNGLVGRWLWTRTNMMFVYRIMWNEPYNVMLDCSDTCVQNIQHFMCMCLCALLLPSCVHVRMHCRRYSRMSSHLEVGSLLTRISDTFMDQATLQPLMGVEHQWVRERESRKRGSERGGGGGGVRGREKVRDRKGERGERERYLFPLWFLSLLQGLSRVRDGLLICEIDLNLIQQIKDKWCLQVRTVLAWYM